MREASCWVPITIEGNPVNDLTLLQEQGRHLQLIVKNGAIHKHVAR